MADCPQCRAMGMKAQVHAIHAECEAMLQEYDGQDEEQEAQEDEEAIVKKAVAFLFSIKIVMIPIS
jgi:hypothetical protein